MEELSEKYLSIISKKKGIDEARTSTLIDLCMKTVGFKINVPFSDVYNAIYNTEYIAQCLKRDVACETLTLEDCEKACHCVLFEGKCRPRYFKDADKINEDPDKYIENLKTDALAQMVKLSAYLYYNYDGGGLTDNSFDAMEYHLNKRLKMKGRRYEKIGAPPIEKIRAKLPYPMPSLDKVKPGSRELYDFLLRASGKGVVYSLKLDGVSALLVYKKGVLSKIYTRGDGAIGGDVTYLKEYIDNKFLPNLKDKTQKEYQNIVVRGEIILSKKTWEEKYIESYSNARSFVSAKVNSGHVSQGLHDLEFLAYDIISLGEKIPSPSKSFEILESLQFKLPTNKILETPTIFDLVTLYKELRVSSSYVIDGLVLSINAPREKETKLGNPKTSVAFKMKLEEQIRQTKVINVEWRITRYGRLFPVAIYESVYVDGVRLHKASAHNAAHIRDWSMGRGTVIKVSRSGDVIPTIVDVKVDPSIEPIFPPESLGWHWKGSDIVLDDPDSSKTVQIKRIEHFFVIIGVPRLREKTIEKLWYAGYKTIKAITNASPSDLIKIKGIGKKTSESHYKNIHETMRTTRLDRYIPASTTLNLGIGRKLVKQLMRYHPSILEDEPEVIKRMLKKKEIPGFGPKRIANVAENVPKFRDFLFSLNKEDIEYALKKDKERRENLKKGGFNQKLRGKTFVLTGFYGKLDLNIEDYIYDNLGNFSDTVTSLTEAVVAANILDFSKKMEAALKLGVPVLSLEEFIQRYNIPKKTAQEDEEGEYAEREEQALGIVDQPEEVDI